MKITRAEANYTGGNIYIYTGQLDDGRFFQTADDWETCVMLLDADPQEHWDDEDEENNCTFEGWQKAHTVEELTDKAALMFWKAMLRIIEKTETYEDWSDRIDYVEGELNKHSVEMNKYRVTVEFWTRGYVDVYAGTEEEAKEAALEMDYDRFDILPETEENAVHVEALESVTRGHGMKLYELATDIYTKYGNAPCCLTVDTEDIALKFGSEYHGSRIKWSGVNGRVNDIPPYVCAYEVLDYTITKRMDSIWCEIHI